MVSSDKEIVMTTVSLKDVLVEWVPADEIERLKVELEKWKLACRQANESWSQLDDESRRENARLRNALDLCLPWVEGTETGDHVEKLLAKKETP
jgi:hypothetical protein